MGDVCRASSMPDIDRLTSAYAVRVTEQGGRRFAALLRQHRSKLGLRQEDVAELSGVDLSTYNRWERGLVTNPKPDQVRDVCRVLRLSTVLAGVALGYLSPEDAQEVPEPPRPMRPEVAEALALLEDPDVPEDIKRSAFEYLQYLRHKTRTPPAGETQPKAS